MFNLLGGYPGLDTPYQTEILHNLMLQKQAKKSRHQESRFGTLVNFAKGKQAQLQGLR